MRRRPLSIALLLVTPALAVAVGNASTPDGPSAAPEPTSAGSRPAVEKLSLRYRAGQRIVTGWQGGSPPKALRRAIRRGDIGGVVVFAANIPSRSKLRRSIRSLQRIPRPAGLRGRPLLVMVDQEGGQVKRLSGAPSASAEVMSRWSRGKIRSEGAATARNVADVGINVDLAPVLDVARPGGAIDREDRGWGTSASRVRKKAIPFGIAMQRRGVAATAKHFPGLGAMETNTDFASQRIKLSKRKLRRTDMAPYERWTRKRGVLVMSSFAVYTRFSKRPAAFARSIIGGELRRRLGYRGVVITDGLDAVAAQNFGSVAKRSRAAAAAGNDILLFSHLSSALEAARTLRKGFRGGRLARDQFNRSVERVLELRSRLAG